MTLAELADLADVSISYISMIERGERTLSRVNHINAIAAALRVSPADLAPGATTGPADLRPSAASAPVPDAAFPAVRDEATMTRHTRLVSEFAAHVARGDTRAAGMWLRRAARDPSVSPWLLLDLIAMPHAPAPGAARASRTSSTTPAAPQPAGPGHPLRRLRLRRGLTQAQLAALAGVSVSYISMIEHGERALTRLDHITAIAAALQVAPAELAPAPIAAHPDLRAAAAPSPAAAFPALGNEATMTRHARLASELTVHIARGDTHATGIWLRRTARDPAVSPWLLLDLLAAHHTRTPGPRQRPAADRPRTPPPR